MVILLALPSLFMLLTMSSADPVDSVSELQGRVYIKNLKQQKYLIFDPLSTEAEPKALLWNVPHTLPPRGGAWFHMGKSPSQNQLDYNLVGGTEWNYTLCASMKQPAGEDSLHNVHGYIDESHFDVPECRWKIVLSFDKQNYWLINSLYGGHLTALREKFNVDPLRRGVFLAVKIEDGEDPQQRWEIGRVLEPNDKQPFDYY